MPIGAALTTASNTFAGNQTINGSLILGGAGSGIQFADGSQQATAATGGGVSCQTPSQISSTSPVVPAGYTPLSQTTAGNVWFTMAPMPTARGELAAVAVNGKIYAIGGISSSGSELSTVEVYDAATNTWSNAPSMQVAREFVTTVDVNGLIYAIGGEFSSSFLLLNTVEQYSPPVTIYTFIKN